MTKMLHILISHETLEVQNTNKFSLKKIKSWSRPHYFFANLPANFPPFVFIFSSVFLSACVFVTLFYSGKQTQQRTSLQTFTRTKKKCNLTVEEIREVWKGLFLSLKCAIYLSERMHIVSIYTLPIHFATGWRAQKLRELITFLLLFIK